MFLLPTPAAIVAPLVAHGHILIAPDNKAEAVSWLNKGLDAAKNDSEQGRFNQQVIAARVYHCIGDQAAARAALEKAKSLVTSKNTLLFIDANAEISEFDTAFALMKEKEVKNSYLYAAIADYQIKEKHSGAKLSLVLAQESASVLDDVMDRAELLHELAGQFTKIGANAEAQIALTSARTALEADNNVMRGIPVLELLTDNVRLQRKAGDTAGAKAALARIEKKTMDSPYVDNERGMVLFEVAAEYRALGNVAQADALSKKAAGMTAKIESEGNEATMFQRVLGRQAFAGDLAGAVERAQKGGYGVAPFVALLQIGQICNTLGDTAKAKQAFVAAKTAADAQPVLGLRLQHYLDLARAMGNAGDKVGAIALYETVAKAIPNVPETDVRPVFWSLLVKRRAQIDVPGAASYLGNVEAKFHKELFFDFAQSTAKAANKS